MFIGSWKFGTKKMNPPLISSILTLNLQELDYIYMYILYLQATYMQLQYSIKRIIGPTNHVYMHTLTYIHIAMQKFAFGSLQSICVLHTLFLRDPVIIKGSSSYFIRLVRSRSRFIYAQNRDVSSMCGLLLKFSWQRTMVWFLS